MLLLAVAFDMSSAARDVAGWLQNIATASGTAEVLFGVVASVIGFVRWRASKKNDHQLTAQPDQRVIAIAENLANLPVEEQMQHFMRASAAVVGEMSEQNRRLAEAAGRDRRESEEREKKLLIRIDELTDRVDLLLGAADEYSGREMAYVARIEDLEKQVRSLEVDAGALSEARERITALEDRLAQAHARIDAEVEHVA